MGKVNNSIEKSNEIESDVVMEEVGSDVILVADEPSKSSSWTEYDESEIESDYKPKDISAKNNTKKSVAEKSVDVESVSVANDTTLNVPLEKIEPAPVVSEEKQSVEVAESKVEIPSELVPVVNVDTQPEPATNAAEPDVDVPAAIGMEPATSWSEVAEPAATEAACVTKTAEPVEAPVAVVEPTPIEKAVPVVAEKVSDDVKNILSDSKKFADEPVEGNDLYNTVNKAQSSNKVQANNVNTFDNDFMFDSPGAALGGKNIGGGKFVAIIAGLIALGVAGFMALSGDDTAPVKNPEVKNITFAEPAAKNMAVAKIEINPVDQEVIDLEKNLEVSLAEPEIVKKKNLAVAPTPKAVKNLDADLDDLLGVEKLEFNDYDVTAADWQESAIISVSKEILPKNGVPAMEFTTQHYDMLFDGLRIQVEKIPNGVNFLNGKSEIKDSLSVGPAALFVLNTPENQQMVRLNMLYLNLNKYVVVGRNFAEVSLNGVWDEDNSNLLGDKLFDHYEPALIDNRYKDVSEDSLLSSYEIGLREKNVSDIYKITGKVRFSFPQKVKVTDFLTRDIGTSKEFLAGLVIKLAEVDRNFVRLTYDFDGKNIIELWVYDAKGKRLPQKSFKKTAGELSVRLGASAGKPAIIRVVTAASFEQRVYPFELTLK